VKDPDLEAYVEAIEGHLRARRGVEHILSPRDFALARTWHEAGVPLATVLVGMDRAFETSPDVTSLAFCRRRVEDLFASGPRPRARPAATSDSLPLDELTGLLGALLERLERIRAAPGSAFSPPLRKIREVQDLLAVAARPNWAYVRAKLQEIDDDVSSAALHALPAEQVAEFRAEARAAIERHRGRMAEDALDDAARRYTLQRAREKLGLPRVSLA
jgi:hypothetical protein